jgi:hypothetical protein
MPPRAKPVIHLRSAASASPSITRDGRRGAWFGRLRPRLLFITISLGVFALRGARAEDVRAIAALIVNGAPQPDTTVVWRVRRG